MEENNQEETKYINFSGMNRPAVFFGLPIMIFLGLSALTILVGLPLFMKFGLKGLIYFVIMGFIYFVLRSVIATDPNALKILNLKFKGYLLKGNSILVLKENLNLSGKEQNEKYIKRYITKRLK